MSHRTLQSHDNIPLQLSKAIESFPTLAQTQGGPKTSERYAVITTASLLDRMAARGFNLYSVSATVKRDPANRPFAKHLVRLRHNSAPATNGYVPEICIVNSNDGVGAWSIFAGLMRYVCLNNVVAGSLFCRHRVAHKGDAMARVIDASYTVIEDMSRIADTVNEWSNIRLTDDRAAQFAERAHAIRFGDDIADPDNVAARFEPARLLEARRDEDRSNDLWTIFNRVQENTVRGGLKSIMVTDNNKVSVRSIRPVNNVDRQIAVNTQLWDLAESFAKPNPVQRALDAVNAELVAA